MVKIEGLNRDGNDKVRGAGIQRHEGHNLVVITGTDGEGDTARSSGLPGTSRGMTGWRTRVNRKAILFFTGFPPPQSSPPKAGTTGFGENDGVVKLHLRVESKNLYKRC